jgi:rhamnogalacturonan endolyase
MASEHSLSFIASKGQPTDPNLSSSRPTGFRNADKQLRMHPSDSRMDSWSSTYTVGSSSLSDFPMAVFKSVNNPVTIKFTATSAQTGAATLRIGTTLSFAGGRPQATVSDSVASGQ